MIMFLREMSERWPAKILLGLVAISMMSLFGLGGMTSLWGRDDKAIIVGDTVLRAQDLQTAFHHKIKQMSAYAPNGYLSPADAMNMGLLSTVIEGEVATVLKSYMIADLETIASDDSVRNYIVNNPAFQTNVGQFDRPLFNAYLRQMGQSEAGFSDMLRQELAYKHITDAVGAIAAVPNTLADKMYAFDNEKRSLAILPIMFENVPLSQKPSTEELQDYYDAMSDSLYAPEYRTLSVVTLKGDNVENIARTFDDKIGAGQKLEDVAKELKLSVQQGLVVNVEGQSKTGKKWDNPLALQEAFTLPQGEVSPLIEQDNGYVAVRVDDIEPSTLMPFEKVQNKVATEWKKDKQKEKLSDYANDMLKQAKAGKSLDALASLMGGKVKTFQNVKRSELANLPENIKNGLFSADINTPVLLAFGDGFILTKTSKITPAAAQNNADKKALIQKARESVTAGLIGEMQGYYAKEYGLQINAPLIEKTFSVYTKKE